jgi:hypothetical protein
VIKQLLERIAAIHKPGEDYENDVGLSGAFAVELFMKKERAEDNYFHDTRVFLGETGAPHPLTISMR